MAAQYPGLEVVPREQAGLEHYQTTTPVHEPLQYKYEVPYVEPSQYDTVQKPDRRICGLSRRAFGIVFGIIAAIIVAGAVGGGVGGSLASKSKDTTGSSSSASPTTSGTTSTSASASTTSSATTGPITPAPTTTPALSTSTVVGPSSTLLRDCPSSNNTLYRISLQDDTLNFRKVCGMAYLNSINGGDVVNKPTTSLNDCINLCAAYNLQNATGIRSGSNNVCNAVCWRNTFINDGFPGQCFGFTTTNSSNEFVIRNESLCDSAAWIDQKFL